MLISTYAALHPWNDQFGIDFTEFGTSSLCISAPLNAPPKIVVTVDGIAYSSTDALPPGYATSVVPSAVRIAPSATLNEVLALSTTNSFALSAETPNVPISATSLPMIYSSILVSPFVANLLMFVTPSSTTNLVI